MQRGMGKGAVLGGECAGWGVGVGVQVASREPAGEVWRWDLGGGGEAARRLHSNCGTNLVAKLLPYL